MAALGLSPKHSRPEWFVLEALPVPPPCVRPSARNDMGQRSEDDLTVALQSIVKYNNMVKKKLSAMTARRMAARSMRACSATLAISLPAAVRV